MDTVKSYFIVVGLYIFFMLISFKYSPLSDAINAPSYQPVFDGEKFLDISIASIREMFKEDSATIRKILIYGIEQYLDIFEYPYCTVDPDFQKNQQWPQSIQFVVSYISTGWIFLIFQRITGRVTDDFCYREDGHTISFIVKMSYTFYVENIIGYIAQITIYWMQRIVLSKPVSYILDFFYKLVTVHTRAGSVKYSV